MAPRPQDHYSQLYSRQLPGERQTSVWPYILGGVLLAMGIVGTWWIATTQSPLTLFTRAERPTVSERVVALELAGQSFRIPENYLRSNEQRAGGQVTEIELYTIWPTMRGFNENQADEFRDKSNGSRVIYITLSAPAQLWRPAERFYQVYPYYFAGPEEPAEFDLMRRRMDDGSGLGDHDVLYHQGKNSFHLYHCLRDKSDLIPADCIAEKILEPRVLVRYRFRQPMLADWQAIDAAVDQLLDRFAVR